MTTYIAWRILKAIGVTLLAVGTVGPAFVRNRGDRARLVYGVGTVGWVLTWIAGYGILKTRGISMSEDWVTAGLFWSTLALGAALGSIQRPVFSAISAGAWVASATAMGLRHADPRWYALALIPLVVVGAFASRTGSEGTAPDPWRWFEPIAWAEGVSLLLLFGLYMPLKYGFDIHIDGHQGWFGWAHGVFFVLYLVALMRLITRPGMAAGRRVLWGVVGLVAAQLPFGSFAFERWVSRSIQISDG